MDKGYSAIPQKLKDLKQWVCYSLEQRSGKTTKVPKNPHTGKNAQSNNADTWSGFEKAVEAAKEYNFDGVGLMFANNVCGIDIDHCVENGKLSPIAEDIVNIMDSYTEFSPSGTGIHILFYGSITKSDDFYTKNPNNGVEMYDHERYFTVTGHSLNKKSTLEDRTEQLKIIQNKYMRRQNAKSTENTATATAPLLTDNDILAKANASSKATEFSKLWSGDISGYNSHSDADLALCNMLAFWSGRNADTIDRLFRQSGLMRDKWDVKHGKETYGNMTINKAIESCTQVYAPNNSPYVVDNGHLYRKTGQNERKHIANFIAYPIEDLTKDNGTETSRFFVLGGKLESGEKLPDVAVSAAEFSSMNWLMKCWGLRATVSPGNSNKDYLRDYIQSQAAEAKNSVVYTHTGFRKIDGKLCYLYNGGAIGADSVRCELEQGITDYTFTKTQPTDSAEALKQVLKLFNLAPPEASYPLLAFTYLAPLNYFLDLDGIAPAFSLFLVGETGSFKTAISLLYLSHFRKYRGMSDTPPVNFHSTSNAIEKMSFDLKDALLLIDDYHPTTAGDKKRMDQIAQRLARGAGDHTSRSRMSSDTTLKKSFPPRGLSMVTGEDLPDVGQSGLARYYFVNFKKDNVNTNSLTECQNNAELLNAAMQGYIKWLIDNENDLRSQLKEKYVEQLKLVNLTDSHSRTAPVISWLQLAIQIFTLYLCDMDVFTEAEGVDFCSNAWAVFLKGGADQIKTQTGEAPTNIFLSVLEELLASGRKATEDINGLARDAPTAERSLGFHDDEYYYLRPNDTYNAVVEVLRSGGRSFPVRQARLFSDLIKDGYAQGQGDNHTVRKRIFNTNLRYLKLKKSAINCEERI